MSVLSHFLALEDTHDCTQSITFIHRQKERIMSKFIQPASRKFGALLFLALLIIGIDSSQAVSRDWAKHPAIVEIDTKQDIYAIGDVHGDYKQLVTLLVKTKLISHPPEKPDQVEWNAGKSVLVCTGDIIDKGHHSIDALNLLRALQTSAAAKGGHVVVTSGNHEAAFLETPTTDGKAEDFVNELDALGVDPEEVAKGHDTLGIGQFLLGLPFAARVNDWFFVHAGNVKKRSLKELKSALEQGVDKEGYGAEVLVGKGIGILEVRMNSKYKKKNPRTKLKTHPWWEKRDDKPKDSEKRLRELVEGLGVKHLVFGHQNNKYTFNDKTVRKAGAMFQKFDGLVFLIDVGMSYAIGKSQGAVLRIHREGQTATAHYPDRKSQQLWPKP